MDGQSGWHYNNTNLVTIKVNTVESNALRKTYTPDAHLEATGIYTSSKLRNSLS